MRGLRQGRAFEASTNDPLACATAVSDLAQARACIAMSTGDQVTSATIACFLNMIPNQYASFASCIMQLTSIRPQPVLGCVTSSSISEFSSSVPVVNCLLANGPDLIRQ